MSSGPIYIGGVSYSGKTQLRLLLSKHPNIVITRRTYLWRTIYNKFGDLSLNENFEQCLSEILRLKHLQKLNPDPDRIRREFWQGEISYSRLFSLLHQHYAEGLGKSRWGIQIGMVEGDSDLILSAEPNAKIIQVIRNPADRIEESLSSASFRLGVVGMETSRWEISAKLGMQNLKKYPKNYLFIKWENLLEDVENTLIAVCDFVGEDYHPSMSNLENLKNMGLIEQHDPSTNQRQLAQVERSNHQTLSEDERLFVKSFVEPEMSYFGYNTTNHRLPFFEMIKYLFVVYPANLLGVLFWKLRNS